MTNCFKKEQSAKKCKKQVKVHKKCDENRQILEKYIKNEKWHMFCELYKQRIGNEKEKRRWILQ
ncbi:hypothetical protein LG34_16425 [Eubacterium ramulus]|uniref:Uncharacterized protein n=1 Tax=Eubacterium ramulus TaxID=39490 RepID=A0A2V1JSE8_EUBRA|nr:hypothetical protein LG34_16425 [Eubacterium ramulus]